MSRALIQLSALLVALMLSACAAGLGGNVAPAPGVPWRPPRPRVVPGSDVPHADAAAESAAARRLSGRTDWTLGDLIDVALERNPLTREAWENARAAAARYGGEKGAYFPALDANANILRQKAATGPDRAQNELRSYGGSLDLSWLIYDFGGREAAVAAAREAWRAANWTHNAAIQDVIYAVRVAYFDHATARALSLAEAASLEEARRNLAAADARHASGVATIADVLQARTAEASARLALEEVQGRMLTTRGALATTLGLPANLAFEVQPDTVAPAVEQTLEAVETYLARARAERPDLAAAEALVARAGAVSRRTRAEGYPTITAGGSLGRTYFDSADRGQESYSAVLRLNLPLFTGFTHRQDVRAAEAEERAARARAERVARNVALDVWTSYSDLKTAARRVATTDELRRSASESHDVAAGRYRAGVGDILDLLQAQTALENARARQVQARADWYLAVARLAYDTGTLTRTSQTPAAGNPPSPAKDEQR